MSVRTRFHYFKEDGMSLCSRWMNAFGLITLEAGNDDHPANCATCKKRKAALKKKDGG